MFCFVQKIINCYVFIPALFINKKKINSYVKDTGHQLKSLPYSELPKLILYIHPKFQNIFSEQCAEASAAERNLKPKVLNKCQKTFRICI